MKRRLRRGLGSLPAIFKFCFCRDKFSTDTRRLLGAHATIPAKTAFAHRQASLRGRVRRFQQESLRWLGVDDEKDVMLRLASEDLSKTNLDLDEEGWGELVDVEFGPDSEEIEDLNDDDEDREDEDPVEDGIRPDRSVLLMPSSISPLAISKLNIGHLKEAELELRKGQANDSLEGLMLALCTQGLLLRTKVRNAEGTKGKTRAFDEVTKVRREVEASVRSYRRARKAILSLSMDPQLAEQYKPIVKSDLRTADITDERRLGQSNDNLAWFWRLGAENAGKDEWTEECELYQHIHPLSMI